MMMFRMIVAGTLTVATLTAALAQHTGTFGKPRVSVRPLALGTAPSTPATLFGTVPSFIAPGSDFFPAAPTTLFDNTGATQYYFSSPSIVLDDVLIPDDRDTDGDSTYYLTEIELAFYIPVDQTVNYSVYLARATAPLTPNPDDLQAPIAVGTAENLTAGAYILTVSFERCNPKEIPALQVSPGGSNYDHFLVGLDFGTVCTDGPGWLLAAGPDASYNAFYWNGNQVCGGTAGPGTYWFGGNPVASFHLKVTGAATREDAIVVSADLDDSGCVDDADLLTVLFNFGSDGSDGGDANCDGIVDDADLLEVLFNFGSGC